ncbi:MAG: N-6 DNA methylase [Bacteroidaceae bacterium]
MAQYSNIHRPDVSFVWNITDIVLRDTFKKSEIGDVILPFVVLRRLDCILEPVNEKVRQQYIQLKDKVAADKLDPALRRIAGHKFYNISRHTLISLLDDARNISVNFNNYLYGFNDEVQTIFQNFQFDKVIARLNRNNLLYRMIQEITRLDFSLQAIDNHDMGYVFEELIRIANDQSNEQAGEHFTPRDVIRLMSAVLFTPDADNLKKSGIIRSIYDPTCGTGGMVNVGKRYILEDICGDGSPKPTIMTFGQELNEQSYAIAKSEALVSGEDADNIKLGNSFTQDQFPTKRFHYIMANPPYGVTWVKDKEFIIGESLRPEGRFTAGTPRTSDGQLLFVQHMLSKMEADGSRVGVVTNGSPLFSGGAGSGESNIRKWIIENDWLECIIGLPKDLFYNTGIFTYIWIFTNKKRENRRGKVQLINAVDFCTSAMKSLGNKRNDILQEHIDQILKIYLDFEESEYSKIIPNQQFGKYELTIEQPLRDEEGKLKLKSGKKQADSSKRDTEKVPLDCNVKEFFATEVLPHIDPESWIDYTKVRTSYEINFTRYFYKYEALEPSETIAERIMSREEKIHSMIVELFK